MFYHPLTLWRDEMPESCQLNDTAPKTLVIAEKPSVAADIARALGGMTKHDDFF